MCDFRGPPIKIQNVQTGEILDVNYYGCYRNPLKHSLQPGMYHVPGSGSYYAYFDGENYWRDNDAWGKKNYEYWPEDGMPKQFTQYRWYEWNYDTCVKTILQDIKPYSIQNGEIKMKLGE